MTVRRANGLKEAELTVKATPEQLSKTFLTPVC
jgi:hypothetical protein